MRQEWPLVIGPHLAALYATKHLQYIFLFAKTKGIVLIQWTNSGSQHADANSHVFYAKNEII